VGGKVYCQRVKNRGILAPMNTTGFLDRLWWLQGQRGLSDVEMAKVLRISHPHLWRLKHRLREPGLKTILSAVREFPELAVFVSGNVRQGKTTIPMRKSKEAP
jgi:hypothetical protein